MTPEPRWLTVARSDVGLAEVPGPASNPRIREMWLRLRGGAWYWSTFGQDDSLLPWCGGWMASVWDRCGLPYPRDYARARAWLEVGVPLVRPALGAVVVFERGKGGHVGLVVGRYSDGQLGVLGANQRDSVRISAFPTRRVLGYRWPEAQQPIHGPLPTLGATAESSSNEV